MTAYAKTDGLTYTESQEMRRGGAQIYGCWWCLTESSPRPYWFAEDVVFIGHRVACRKHKDRELA